jgi:CRP/FNR family cyclic AMP-dependent transcriptional regulator
MSEKNPSTPNNQQRIAELRAEGILTHVSPEDLETLKFYGVFGEYAPGEIVIQEGIQQDNLYYVVEGKLDVFNTAGGSEVMLGTIGQGDCIGEVSIFEPGPASATVRVVDIAILWHLDVNSLQSFFEQIPTAGGQVMLGIAQLLSKRLRQANQAIIANRLTPKHLAVRSGRMTMPITVQTVGEGEEKSTGLFGIFKKKNS